MGRKLKTFIGRHVRLKYKTFERAVRHARRPGVFENLFVVAAITRGMNKLVCYGSNIRVIVSLSDIVLI